MSSVVGIHYKRMAALYRRHVTRAVAILAPATGWVKTGLGALLHAQLTCKSSPWEGRQLMFPFPLPFPSHHACPHSPPSSAILLNCFPLSFLRPSSPASLHHARFVTNINLSSDRQPGDIVITETLRVQHQRRLVTCVNLHELNIGAKLLIQLYITSNFVIC